MSGNATLNALAQDIIHQSSAAFALRYSILSAAVLLLYDYVLTFPLELQHIWSGKINILKIMFILNRYCSLCSLFGCILLYFVKWETNTECNAIIYIKEIAEVLTAFALFSIFTLRTYAIYGKSRTVFLLLAIPAFVQITSDIWVFAATTTVAVVDTTQLQLGLITSSCTFNESSFSYVNMIAFVSGAVFDGLVVILTVYRTARLTLQSRKANISRSLSFILIRDGILYYSAIFVPEFVLVALTAIVLKPSSNNLKLVNVLDSLDYIYTLLQYVLVNRLVLNLTHAANTREDTTRRTTSRLELPIFASSTAFGSISGSVHTLWGDLDNEGLEEGDAAEGGI